MDLKNKRFGKLFVIDIVDKCANKSHRWLCRCECGKLRKFKQTALIDGIVKSCGCDIDRKNIIGSKFGRLTIIDTEFINHKTLCICKCECGNITKQRFSSLTCGDVKSCGCLGIETKKKGKPKHNLYYTRLYKIYNGMKNRCYCATDYHYKRYGARGIKICDEWLGSDGFVSFYNWAINNGYSKELSIDRIDNNGDYCPKNCRWATVEEQQNNTRKNVWFNYLGEKLTLSQISKKYNIHASTLWHRLKKYNGDIYKSLEEPVKHEKNRYKNKSGF